MANQQHVLFTGELKMTAKRVSMGQYRPKDRNLYQHLADWWRYHIKNILFSICANWLTVHIITVNRKHVQVNSLSFNSVLFYFLQDFQLIAWCSDYRQMNSAPIQSSRICWMVQQLETLPSCFNASEKQLWRSVYQQTWKIRLSNSIGLCWGPGDVISTTS